MTSIVLALLLASSPAQVELPSLGTNLAGISDWTTQWPFVDAFKLARPWISQKTGADWGKGDPLDIDENGNVRSLKPGQYAETVIWSNGHHPTGNYTLTWKGSGEFAAESGSTLRLVGPGKANVEAASDKGIYIKLTQVDPKDPPREIRLIMPGFEETYETEPFHPVFLQRMSLYRCLRFMDWGATNNSPVKSWKERAQLGQTTYTTAKGVPLELMIDLANEKVSMPWFCIPHQADDDFVRETAKLIKSRLKPTLRIAVEYSNECWNQDFAQTQWCVEQGTKLNLSDNPTQAGLRYYAQRSLEIFKIFEDVLGGKQRLFRVLSAQSANPNTGEEILDWKDTGSKCDAIAIAPYFGYGLGSPDKAEATKSAGLDGIYKSMEDDIRNAVRDKMDAYAVLARRHRIKLVSYEGGQHLVAQGAAQDDADLNRLFDEANRNQRIQDVYLHYLKSWRSAGGALFMHFTDCAPFSKYGRFGTIEYQDQDPLTSYKNQAMIQFALFPDR